MAGCFLKRSLLFGPPGVRFGLRWASGYPRIEGVNSGFVGRPSLFTALHIVVNGKPNPDQLPGGLDVKEFVSGAHLAIHRTSEILASENIEDSSELFGSEILSKLKATLSELGGDERKQLSLEAEDIFFSWIDDNKENQVRFVALSFPKYAEMRRNAKEKSALEAELKQEMKDLASQGRDVEFIRGRMECPQIKSLNQERVSMHQDGEVIVSNVSFNRSSESAPWVIQDFSMRDSASFHSMAGYHLWKFRLKVAIESQKDFIAFLRFDYFTNFLIVFGTFVPVLFSNSG